MGKPVHNRLQRSFWMSSLEQPATSPRASPAPSVDRRAHHAVVAAWSWGTVRAVDVPEPVLAVLHAANNGDVEAFLGCFEEGGVVDDWGREFAGRDAIRRWSDAEFIGKQVTLAVTAVEQQGGLTVVSAEVGGTGFNGPSHFSFDVDGPKVTRMTIRA